jgi:hypothetical protein
LAHLTFKKNKKNNVESFISTNKIFLKIQYLPSQFFVIWKIILSTFLFKKISVEVAKIVGYYDSCWNKKEIVRIGSKTTHFRYNRDHYAI